MTATLSMLDRTRAYAQPALRAAVGRLDPTCRLVASYHLGWCDTDGRPATGGGGKAVRPALAMLAAEAVGAPAATALPGAVAVELVHNFSLLHDDLIDGDEERRHRPTAWAVWGPATAILTGDALLALAHEVLLEADPPGAGRAAWVLATTTRELTRGQTQDIAFETRADVTLDECLAMAAAKTGSLLAASTAIGGRARGRATADGRGAAHVRRASSGSPSSSSTTSWASGATRRSPASRSTPTCGRARSRCRSPTRTARGSPTRRSPTGSAARARPTRPASGAIAELLSAAGARDWALDEARRRMAAAEQALCAVDLDPGARAELLALARFVVDRDS